MTPPVLLGMGALGLLLLGSKKASAVVNPVWTFPPVPPPHQAPRAAPPLPQPHVAPAPALDFPPNGRHLSVEEKTILAPFIPRVDLDSAVLWWNTPDSSFTSEDPNIYVNAVTTARGIYLRDPNHAITETFEYVTLGHELVHVGQYRKGILPGPDTPAIELPAYQTGLAIEKHLESLKRAA